MEFSKSFYKVFLYFIVFVLSFNYFGFCSPSFDFSTNSYKSGVVDVVGQASSGTKIDLYINSKYVDTKQVNLEPKYINLTDDIYDFSLGIGQKAIFKNSNPNHVYKINISSKNIYKVLNPNEVFYFSSNQEEKIMFLDMSKNIYKTITINDEFAKFNFSQVNNYLQPKQNNFIFVQKYFAPKFDLTKNYSRNVNFEMYSDVVNFASYKNVTNMREVRINGSIDDDFPLYYSLNKNPLEIGNIGSLIRVQTNNSKFSTVVNHLVQGNNTIYFVATDKLNPNIFVGISKVNVFCDSLDPYLNILEISFDGAGDVKNYVKDLSLDKFLVNSKKLFFKVESDAKNLSFYLNPKDESLDFVDKSVFESYVYVEDFSYEVDGKKLFLNFKFDGAFKRFDVSYKNHNKSYNIENKESSFDLVLDKDFDKVYFYFYDLEDSVHKKVLNIYPRAFEEVLREVKSFDFVNKTLEFEVELENQENYLVFYAFDVAGNKIKKSHKILFDDLKPDLIDDEMEPNQMFKNGVTHFAVQKIEGKTTKPNVEVTVFTIAKDSKNADLEEVDCEDFESIFVRYSESDSNSDEDDMELGLDDVQISLTDLIFQKKTVVSDENGKFGSLDLDDFNPLFISLKSKSLNSNLVDSQNPNKNPIIENKASKNKVCFVLKDDFGNVNIREFKIELDTGNSCWKSSEIITMPDTKYASEIEMISEQSSDNDQFSLIAKFDYICSGKVTNINSFSIHEDLDTSSDLGSISIDSSSMHFSFDQDAQEMLVYVPVKILPLDVLPSEYPDSMEFGFYAKPTYSVDSVGVPIDNSQIFFKAQINIERPHDHTMWLTPETISDSIKFLNDSIDFTKKTVDWTGYASVGGLLACTGAKFWYNFQVGLLNADDKDESNPNSKINELKERLYLICDRVACTESPKVCGTFDDEKFFDVQGKTRLEEGDLSSASIINKNSEDKDILASFTSLNIGSECTYSNGQSGALVTSHLKTYERDETPSFWKPTKETEVFVRNKCVPANFGCFDSNGVSGRFEKDGNCAEGFSRKVSGVDLQELSGVCFQAGAPKFDNTRCNFFGADSLGVPNKNPKDNIIESVRCGCLTSTYSHLKKFLEIQTQLKMCLEQARVGDVEGSYCERLLSTAICDVGTNIMFKTIFSSSSRDDGTGEDNRGAISKFFSNMGRGDALLDKRYEGTFYSQAGLNSESVFHKVCLASLTGDWSVLTDNILTSIDENEVEPSFGPLFPSSRIIGYDPITGKMRVKYFFTYAGVSGGQRVKSRVRFICNGQDKQTGKYCPKGVHYASDLGEGELFTKNLYIEEDGSAQETIVIVDDDARFIYNEIEIEHEFEVDGKSESETFSEGINHKFNSLIGSCYWGTGIMGDNLVEGIHCDKMFSEESLVSMFSIDKQMTRLVPKRAEESLAVFYPGHKVLLDLFYFRQGTGSQDKFRVHYLAKCPSKDNEPVYGMSSDVISADPKVVKDHKLVEIFNVPQFGISSVEGFDVVKLDKVYFKKENPVASIVLRKKVDEDLKVVGNKILIKIENGDDKEFSLEHGFRVSSVIVNDKEIGLSEDLLFSSEAFEYDPVYKFVSFKLDLNEENLGLVNSEFDEESSENRVMLKFDRKVEDSNFYLVFKQNQKKLFSSSVSEEGVSTNSEFNGLKPGICSLKVRILPEQVTGIGVDNFESFSPVSSNFTNVDFNDMFSTSFRVLKEPKTGEFFSYEVLDPFFNQMICLKDGKGFEVRTAFLDFGEFKKEEYKFVVSFSSDEFLISSKKQNFSLDESIFIKFDNLDLPQKVSKFKVNMFVDLVKKKDGDKKEEVIETQKQEFYLGDCSTIGSYFDNVLTNNNDEPDEPSNGEGEEESSSSETFPG